MTKFNWINSMTKFFLVLIFAALIPETASAGIDAAINEATAPIASAIGATVFFKIPVFGAQLSVVRIMARYWCRILHVPHGLRERLGLQTCHPTGAR